MSEEWGPWIEHDGGPCPAPGCLVAIQFRVKVQPGDKTRGNPDCDWAEVWDWWHDGTHDDIIRYRIRKPRALLNLIELVENLPAPFEPKVDA